jgi:hypothetical protein
MNTVLQDISLKVSVFRYTGALLPKKENVSRK